MALKMYLFYIFKNTLNQAHSNWGNSSPDGRRFKHRVLENGAEE